MQIKDINFFFFFMFADGLSFIWDSENWQMNLYFFVPRFCQDIEYCQNAAGTAEKLCVFT